MPYAPVAPAVQRPKAMRLRQNERLLPAHEGDRCAYGYTGCYGMFLGGEAAIRNAAADTWTCLPCWRKRR